MPNTLRRAGDVGQVMSSSRSNPLPHTVGEFLGQRPHRRNTVLQRRHQRRPHDHPVRVGTDLRRLLTRPHAQSDADRNVRHRLHPSAPVRAPPPTPHHVHPSPPSSKRRRRIRATPGPSPPAAPGSTTAPPGRSGPDRARRTPPATPSASSGIRSGVIIPSPPAAARSRANASTPQRNTGFQYVITTARPPALLIASTAASASRTRTPPRSAASVAAAIVGSVHARVRVRDADFDDVATGFDHGRHRRNRGRHIGESRRQVADQRRTALARGTSSNNRSKAALMTHRPTGRTTWPPSRRPCRRGPTCSPG